MNIFRFVGGKAGPGIGSRLQVAGRIVNEGFDNKCTLALIYSGRNAPDFTLELSVFISLKRDFGHLAVLDPWCKPFRNLQTKPNGIGFDDRVKRIVRSDDLTGRYLALLEWGAWIKQLVLMGLLVNVFFPVGLHQGELGSGLVWSVAWFIGKLLVLSLVVVLVETTNAKLRLFRVPDLLSAAFVLAGLALMSTFLFQ